MSRRSGRAQRGVFLVPTLMTASNLAMGCAAVSVLFDRGEQAGLRAAILILVAAILDGFDGFVARATKSCSTFGMEFDSMADVISFGVAPAWLMYVYCLDTLWRPAGLVACVWYVFGTAFRLARFNAASQNTSSNFSGLPSPAAAGTIASFVILMETLPRLHLGADVAPPSGDFFVQTALAPWAAILMAMLGWLMMSATPYLALKGIDLARPRPIRVVVAVVVFGFAIVSFPQLLFPLSLLYIFTGLVAGFLTRVSWAELVLPTFAGWAARRLAEPRQTSLPAKLK